MTDKIREKRFHRELGAALGRARKASGLTQWSLASMVGWQTSSICHVEKGRFISLRRYLDLTAALKLGPCNLLKLAAAIAANET